MPVVYRLSSVKYQASSGKGAAMYGGRWNLKGVDAVYAGASRALCILERMVHLSSYLPDDEAITTISIPEDLTIAELHPLPRLWKSPQVHPSVQKAAVDFSAAQNVAATRVPSIIVPGEFCYVLWPLHPDFRRIRFGEPELFRYDGRLRPDLQK
jgi:RES domain-containing protein